jgi:hypothetical protein
MHRLVLAVEAEDLSPATGRPDQPELQPDRRLKETSQE